MILNLLARGEYDKSAEEQRWIDVRNNNILVASNLWDFAFNEWRKDIFH